MRCILTVNFSPWSAYSGGGQRSTHNLARALAQRGHDVSVVFTKPPWEPAVQPPDLPYEAVWATLPVLRSGTALSVAMKVRQLLARGSEEAVVHGNGEEAALIPMLKHMRIRRPFAFVMTPRYPKLPALLRYLPRPALMDTALLTVLQSKYLSLGRALRAADWICPTSAYAASLVQRAYDLPSDDISVVPNGISDEFLARGKQATESGTAPLAARTTGVFFGRLVRDKGVRTIVDALACSPEPSRFVFVGRGPERARLQRDVERHRLAGRVRFMDWLDVDDLAELVRGSTYAVLPSLAESFGNSIAEAMALAVPVISTRAGSIPELVQNGRTGLLVPPGDASALADAMRSLARDPLRCRELGAAGQRHVLEHLTWDASAAAFEGIYERALRQERQLPSA